MQSISVAGDGLNFLFKCIALYNGSSFFLLLYLLGLVFIAIKGTPGIRRVFLYPGLIILFTVYNPLLPLLINRLFDVNKEYYRFLWIPPVCILPAFLAASYVMGEGRSRGFRI